MLGIRTRICDAYATQHAKAQNFGIRLELAYASHMRPSMRATCGKSAQKNKTKPHRTRQNPTEMAKRIPQKWQKGYKPFLGQAVRPVRGPALLYTSVILIKSMHGCCLSIMVAQRFTISEGGRGLGGWQGIRLDVWRLFLGGRLLGMACAMAYAKHMHAKHMRRI